jgi:hypothetical protein
MSISNTQEGTTSLNLKQRLFIGALGVLSIILAAVVLFCFSPKAIGEATTPHQLSQSTYSE